MKITLKNDKGFAWYKNQNVFVKGFFHIDSVFYEKEDALVYLIQLKNEASFLNFLNQVNGVFTIILSIKETTFIITDVTRSFPVFYTSHSDEFFISDDILYLSKKFNFIEFDPVSELELNASCHTYGKKTLLKNVYQTQASECIKITNNEIVNRFFNYSYAVENENSLNYSNLKNDAVIAIENSFQRFIQSLHNRPVAIPLSGGFDSRLIAVFLKKYNYKNVVCYTYGRKDSFEIEISKKVAKKLGFHWYFIEYSNETTSNYINSKSFKEYAHFAGKLCSMPNLQEYFAVKYLKENRLISDDTIFIPGYAGDLLGGSQYLKVIPNKLKQQDIIDLIIKEKYGNTKISEATSHIIKKNIEKILLNFNDNYKTKIPSTIFEDHDIKEKIAKYIFNSASFYTFFDYQFRFPFWDREILDFFKSVPIKYKKMKVLFDDVLINNYFNPFHVHFKTELQPSKRKILIQKLKNKIKSILPNFIKQKILQKSDWINYKPITETMLHQMRLNNVKLNTPIKNYNQIITQWYIAFSKNLLK